MVRLSLTGRASPQKQGGSERDDKTSSIQKRCRRKIRCGHALSLRRIQDEAPGKARATGHELHPAGDDRIRNHAPSVCMTVLTGHKRRGNLDSGSREFAREHSERLWKQLVLVPEGSGNAGAPQWREWAVVLALAVGPAWPSRPGWPGSTTVFSASARAA